MISHFPHIWIILIGKTNTEITHEKRRWSPHSTAQFHHEANHAKEIAEVTHPGIYPYQEVHYGLSEMTPK